jgi:hypothetical protein
MEKRLRDINYTLNNSEVATLQKVLLRMENMRQLLQHADLHICIKEEENLFSLITTLMPELSPASKRAQLQHMPLRVLAALLDCYTLHIDILTTEEVVVLVTLRNKLNELAAKAGSAKTNGD